MGVHTTQFAIRDAKVGLFEPVLRLAKEEMDGGDQGLKEKLVRIAGVCGRTEQAVKEAELARGLGYHAGLLSLAAMAEATRRPWWSMRGGWRRRSRSSGFICSRRWVGGVLPYSFWRKFRGDRECRRDQDRAV